MTAMHLTKPCRNHRTLPLLAAALFTVLVAVGDSASAAGMKLGDICRLKGQEINRLQGLGLVVGLRGTGDSDAAPTARALARMMQLMGGSMSQESTGQLNLKDVSSAKNVALVFVSAEIPAVGGQQGDVLNVSVNAISAKSLEGGYLMMTPMLGPRSDNPTVYAMAQGPLTLSPDGPATTATINGGAKMEATVNASYVKNGMITLILDRDFADFNTTNRIEEEINSTTELFYGENSSIGNRSPQAPKPQSRPRARAIDQLHVEVMIPELYHDNPIRFIASLLDIPIQMANQSSRVVINERDGVVVIGKDVEIAPVLITHRNLRIEAGGRGSLVPLVDGEDESGNAKLKSLADALNALDVPTEDFISIIKTLKRKGDLYGEVVFQ